jgi:hypothetical protein
MQGTVVHTPLTSMPPIMLAITRVAYSGDHEGGFFQVITRVDFSGSRVQGLFTQEQLCPHKTNLFFRRGRFGNGFDIHLYSLFRLLHSVVWIRCQFCC